MSPLYLSLLKKCKHYLDRIWKKVPAVGEKEAQADIEQAIAEGRAEKALNKSETSC